MARFEIKSKDGLSVRFSGKPVYNGSYLKPSSLTFSEVNSPTPIAWEVGDYVDYTRTGMRYYLYSIPQPTKRAKMGSRGDAFSYSGVQFFAATKELEIALFKDLVISDNNIHFSTSPDVATFENVEGVARRIQSCMDYFFPNRWEIRIADFDAVEDAEIIEKINTAKDFALSNGTCLDALSRIYELWQDIGWIHTNENGKEVIIIGYPNKRISENTTDAFVYGKGNGLTAIKKNQTNKDEFATRLYVYGSERNLPARYYNDKDILNAESVDIRNLMLPLDKWGLTDGKPDARKAYLENAEAVAKYGLIPKTHYFDSEDAGADIYPTISGMTIGTIREALTALGQTDSDYFPSAELYPDASQRVDKVRWCDNPDDLGDVGDVLLNGSPSVFDGETNSVDVSTGTRTANIVENKLMASAEFSYSESRTCKVRFSTAVSGYVNDDGFESVVVKMRLSDSNNANSSMSKVVEYPAVLNGGKWEFTLPSVEYDYGQIPKTIFGAYAFLTIAVTLPSGSKDKSISYVLNTGIQHLDLYLIMEKTFLLRLHEIGFDIDKQASLGKGKVISMKTGACAGRSFVIESCRHKGGIYTQGYWDLTLKRQKDNTLGLMFPNINAQIAEGDEFVLTDIAMPELYVQASMLRLLSEGQKLLTRASSIQNLYEPSIDAKVMIEQGRTLREGMFMEISDADVVDNTTEYILIDTLSIHEDESAIPTYKVTLKERRKVTYKGTPSATSTDNTESVEDDVQTEVNIDLSEYAKKAEVEEVSELLSTMWQLEGDTIVATKDVRIKANLIVEQDTSSGGEGQDTPGAGLDEGEVLDIVKGYTYSKSEINKLIDDVNAGDVDLTNYYTKDEVDAKIPSLEGYAKTTEVDNKINELNLSQYAKGSDLDALQAEVDNIDAVLGLSETAEGYINTWAEVKAFLDGYTNEDDLATILSGINADIAKNAENIATLDNDKADNTTVTALAERVSANEGAIDDNAGNIKKNSDAIDALDKRVTDEEAVTTTYKTWWADLKKYIKVEGSNVKIDTNLIVSGDTSSGGSGQDTPASGTVTGIKVSASETLTPNNAGIIDMVSTLASIDVSEQLKDYLLKAGGTIEGVFGALSIKRNNAYASAIRFENTSGVLGYIGINDDYNARVWDKNGNDVGVLLHSGNYSDYALPLSGGTLESGATGVLGIKSSAARSALYFANGSSQGGYFGVDGNGSFFLTDTSWTAYWNLIHSGNIGSQSVASANTIQVNYSRSNTDYDILFTNPRAEWSAGIDSVYISDKSDRGLTYNPSTGTLKLHGNVLIGTTTDSGYKLDVNGGVRFGTGSGCDIWLNRTSGNSYINAGDSLALTTGNSSGNIAFELYANKSAQFYGSVAMASDLSVVGRVAIGKDLGRYSSGRAEFSLITETNTIGENVSDLMMGYNSSRKWSLSARGDISTYGNMLGFYNFEKSAFAMVLDNSKVTINNNTTINGIVTLPVNYQIQWGTTGYMIYGTASRIQVDAPLIVSGNTEINGSLSVKTIAIASTDAVAHLGFSRVGFNYVSIPKGGTLAFAHDNLSQAGSTLYMSEGQVNINGNVGIGTISPAYKLDVNGTGEVLNVSNSSGGAIGIRFSRGANTSWSIIDEGGNLKFIENTSARTLAIFYESSQGANLALAGGLDIAGASKFTSAVTMSSTLDVTSHITTSNRVYASYVFLGKNAEGIYLGNDGIYWHTSSNVWASTLLTFASNGITAHVPVTMSSTLSVGGDTTINGNLVVSGDTSSGSDIRFKDIIKNKTLKIEHIAKAPLFTFKWNDREDDTIHLGSSAQYWEKVTPWLVKGEDFKTLDYATLGVAMGISLAKNAVNHEERIKVLEKENKALKEEIRRITYGS